MLLVSVKLRQVGWLHVEVLTVRYTCRHLGLQFVPHDLPLLHPLVNAVGSLSIQLIHLRLYLLPLVHHLLRLCLSRLASPLHLLSDAVLLISQHSVKIIGSHFEVFPPHEHICGVEGGASQCSDVGVFLFDLFDFFEHFVLHLLDTLILLQYVCHFFHVFRLLTDLFKCVYDECLNLRRLFLNLSFDDLD